MKDVIRHKLSAALTDAIKKQQLPVDRLPEVIDIEEPKQAAHGDFSTNIAMVSAPIQQLPPRKIAQIIIEHIHDPEGIIDKTEIAGPGFINFFINIRAWEPVLREIHRQGELYGASAEGAGKNLQLEFVSANPTGPLHIGHGRGAAVGDSMANILSFIGYKVQREYYVNDSGRQIGTLGKSVFLRYKALFDPLTEFPEGLYQGDYIIELAESLKYDQGKALLEMDETAAVNHCARFAANVILEGIRRDLNDFGVTFDNWYSEQTLYDSGKVKQALEYNKEQGLIYEKDGAYWFNTTANGDEKDRVVIRSSGETTYFASDIAYHHEKYQRGFERVIDVWGADHHGYIPRMRAFLATQNIKPEQFDVMLIKMVNLLRDGAPVSMSTRAGEFETLRSVLDEVGSDAARFIFLTRHYESPLDFDLELAKRKNNDNPVYYVQYVHARISSIMAKGMEKGIKVDADSGRPAELLYEPEEITLIKMMARYPETVLNSGKRLEPHRITYFLTDLASAFHHYYNKHRVLNDNTELTQARLYLILAVQKIIRNGLKLLGVSAPSTM